MSRARKDACAAARMCIEGMRSRFAEPDARYLIELLIRIGEVGTLDLEGTLRKIGEQIGELMGQAPDPTRFYQGMRALAGRTSLVERISRQTWRLCMAGITDPSSPRHQRLLDETPSPCRLEIAARSEDRTSPRENDTADAELADLRDRMKRLSDECDARRAEVESLKSERRQLEDQLLEREITIEALSRQLIELRDKPPAPVEPDKSVALKATLKAERERRGAVENRLRRVLSALRIKLEGAGDLPEAVQLDRILWDSLVTTLAEQLDALEAEEGSSELEPGRAEELRADVELTRALVGRVPRTRQPRDPSLPGGAGSPSASQSACSARRVR